MTLPSWRDRLEGWVCAACLLEATARKAGNVHPEASFHDLCHGDFVRSAHAVAPILAETSERSVGESVRLAVEGTQAVVGRNTNLGIVLLLAPLAAVPESVSLADGIGGVLGGLTRADAVCVYRAIRAANPGGLGTADEEDVSGEPDGTLIDVMRLAADRDAIAAQYARGFDMVLGFGLPFLAGQRDFRSRWEAVIIELQLRLMAGWPDTLIRRKRGLEESRRSAEKATAVLDAGGLETDEGRRRLQEFDGWLRAEGNARNPGATADLVTACVFAALREGVIALPEFTVESGSLFPPRCGIEHQA